MFKYWKAWNISVSILGKEITNKYIEGKELKTEEEKFDVLLKEMPTKGMH
jgi:hypothetical protein